MKVGQAGDDQSGRELLGQGDRGQSRSGPEHDDGRGVGAELSNPGEKMKPGVTVHVAVATGDDQGRGVVPPAALLARTKAAARR